MNEHDYSIWENVFALNREQWFDGIFEKICRASLKIAPPRLHLNLAKCKLFSEGRREAKKLLLQIPKLNDSQVLVTLLRICVM